MTDDPRTIKRPSLIRRAILPPAVITLVMIVLFVTYYTSWEVANRSLHWFLTDLVGMAYGFLIIFSVIFVYPCMYFMGAGSQERVVGALIIPLMWMAKEVIRQCAFFTFGESLFYLFMPIHFNILTISIGLTGTCELICRSIDRLRPGRPQVKIITPLPVIAIAIMLAVLVFTLYDGGARYFFLFGDIYQLLFR